MVNDEKKPSQTERPKQETPPPPPPPRPNTTQGGASETLNDKTPLKKT